MYVYAHWCSQEYVEIRDVLTRMNMKVELLDKWYKTDKNALPPVNVLQPIDTHLGNCGFSKQYIMTGQVFVLQKSPKWSFLIQKTT